MTLWNPTLLSIMVSTIDTETESEQSQSYVFPTSMKTKGSTLAAIFKVLLSHRRENLKMLICKQCLRLYPQDNNLE